MRKTSIAFAATAAIVFAPNARADADLRAQGAQLMSAMEGDAHRVAVLLRTARAARSPGPAKCVDGYLSRIDTSVRHGRDDLAEIRAAVAVGDKATAIRAMGWLASRREAARSASFAADTCIVPTAAQERDQTVVRIVAPPRLPTDHDVFAR